MNDRSLAISILCSHLCAGEGVAPLEPKEYSALAAQLREKKIDPEELLGFSRQDFLQRLETSGEQAERLLRLLDRSASLSFEISRYESMGITLLTRADGAYPKKLKEKLGNSCGGAKGTDSVAEETALDAGGTALAYLSDSMLRKLRNAKTLQAVQQGRLLLLSVVKPDAGFNTGVAMMRNRYIYAQSEATVVIKADYNKGGTWNGATENLRNQWALTLCWNHLSYPGNKALIEKGAIPVGEDWDGSIRPFLEKKEQERAEQLSLFGETE